MSRIVYVLSSFLFVTLAHAASFDCTKAGTKVEHIICDSPTISKLDDKLAVSYKTALKDKAQVGAVMEAQRQWIKKRNDCTNAICVKNAYEARLSSLTSHMAPLGVHKKAPHGVSSKEIMLTNQQGYTVPNGKVWIIKKAKVSDCNVCTADINISGGELSAVDISGITLSGNFELSFNSNNHAEVKMYSGTKIWLGDSRSKLEVTETDDK